MKVTWTQAEAKNFAMAILSDSTIDNVFSLDTECDTKTNEHGTVYWSGPPVLLQIGCRSKNGGDPKAWLLPLGKIKSLPQAVVQLLQDRGNKFIGSLVSSDVKELEKNVTFL